MLGFAPVFLRMANSSAAVCRPALRAAPGAARAAGRAVDHVPRDAQRGARTAVRARVRPAGRRRRPRADGVPARGAVGADAREPARQRPDGDDAGAPERSPLHPDQGHLAGRAADRRRRPGLPHALSRRDAAGDGSGRRAAIAVAPPGLVAERRAADGDPRRVRADARTQRGTAPASPPPPRGSGSGRDRAGSAVALLRGGDSGQGDHLLGGRHPEHQQPVATSTTSTTNTSRCRGSSSTRRRATCSRTRARR